MIISSAIKVTKDGKTFVIMGRRHCSCFQTMFDAGIKRPFTEVQGFVTDEFKFVNRLEAKVIAEKCNQILEGEGKYREETEKFIQDNQSNSSWGFWRGMLNPYAEPRKYPVLTPYELKAVKWLVEGGYETIRRCTGGWATIIRSEDCRTATENLPLARLLSTSTWITTEPINLKELLEAQEERI